MSSSRTDTSLIADRYASALFALAEGKARDVVESELATIAEAIRSDAETRILLAHPLLTRAAKAEAVRTLLTSKKANALTVDAVVKVALAGRLSALPAIADAFAAKCAEARGEVIATVTSARALTAKEKTTIAEALTKATSKIVRVVATEDKELLGGLKVSLGAKELDMSIAGSLERMRRALVSAA